VTSSIATVSLSGTLEEKLAAAAAAGFDGIEIMDADVVTSTLTPAEIARMVASFGLRVEIFQPFRDFEGVEGALFNQNLRRAARKLDVAAELGAPLMLLCSNVLTAEIDDDQVVAEQLHRLGDLAEARGVRVAYEALAWGRYVATFEHAWRLASMADHPAIGTCLDSFHIFAVGSDLSGIARLPADRLFFCQVADARALTMDALSWSRHHRLFPGQGDFDLPRFVLEVRRAGYAGPLSLEVFNDVFRQVDPRRTAVDALRSLRYLDESTGDAEAGIPDDSAKTIDFVELRGDAADIEATLEKLGFVSHGTHVSKNLTLWSEGDARVIVNPQPVALEPTERTAFTGIGVQVPDAARAARRAERLLARAIERPTSAGEKVLRGMLAPDSSELYLSDVVDTGDPEWTREFPEDSDAPGVGILDIDHVSLSQPWEHFDEAVLFYRALLGLRPASLVDVADQRGLVSSLAMESPDRSVRVVLTVDPIGDPNRRSRVPSTHVAFAVEDILTTADALRTRDVQTLPIPANYYDDLALRFELDAESLDGLRSRQILYDRDGEGEFWQLYTLADGDVFFEFVQRRNGYDGYGAGNAPVRRAVQQTWMDSVSAEAAVPPAASRSRSPQGSRIVFR